MDAITQTRTQDQIRLKDLVDLLWRGRLWVVGITLSLTVAAAVLALVLPKSYKAQIIVSAVTNAPGSGGMGGLSSMVSEFSGLASLAGLSVGGDTHKAESLAVLQSEALTEDYLRENNLLPVLYAKLWDPVEKRWKVTNPRRVPTLWRANQKFKRDVRTVTTDTHTGLITLTVVWNDPKLAAQWANGLVKKTNDYLRGQAIAESDRNIEYLNAQALKTDVVGVKQAIYAIMENEINKEMLARGSDEYALKVLDPAVAPEAPYSPQLVMWTLIGLFSGILLCILGAFLRLVWRTS